MSASIQIEANTKFSQNWIQSLFQNRDTDTRFENVRYHCFQSVESLTNARQISFNLPRFLGPNCYLPNKLMLKVQVKITDSATNVVPASDKKIGPINNVLHSLFSTCRVWLGETPITKNPDNYAFKAYIIDLLSFDGFAKYTWLQAQGFYQDVFGETVAQQTAASNNGFNNRRNLFLKDPALPASGYAEDGVIFMGRLHTNLVGADCGLIPGLGMRIVLGLSSNAFVLQAPGEDTAKYKITITNASLFCPVGTVSPTLFRSIEHKLKTEDAKLYIERSEVTNKTISKGNTIFNDSLFPGASLPSRLIFSFVKTSSYIGTQATSPFNFQRKFIKPPPPGPPQPGEGAIGAAAAAMVGRVLGQGVIEGDDGEVFIKRVSLTLNGEQVDGLVEGVASSVSDTANFVRLHLMLGLATSTTGNNLTLDEFHRGFYFVAFDLSASANAAASYVIPAVRQGNLHLQVIFSDSIPDELTMLIYAEYPTLITMDKNRQIRMSY